MLVSLLQVGAELSRAVQFIRNGARGKPVGNPSALGEPAGVLITTDGSRSYSIRARHAHGRCGFDDPRSAGRYLPPEMAQGASSTMRRRVLSGGSGLGADRGRSRR